MWRRRGLAVIGAGAVLAQEVLVQQLRLDRREAGGEVQGQHGHLGDALDRHGGLDGLGRRRAPGERGVAIDQDARIVQRVEVAEALDDDAPGLPFVGRRDLAGRHLAGDRHRAGKVVGVRRAEDRDRPAGLGKGRGVGGVSVHHAADVREGQQQPAVGRRVGRGGEPALDPGTVEVHHDHVVRPEPVVGHATGLDGEHAAGAVHRAGVAEGEVDQAVSRQLEIGLVGFPLQLLVHRFDISTVMAPAVPAAVDPGAGCF